VSSVYAFIRSTSDSVNIFKKMGDFMKEFINTLNAICKIIQKLQDFIFYTKKYKIYRKIC